MQTIHINASAEYDVLIGEGLLDKSGELTAKVVRPCKCLLVSDDTVDELYGDRAQISFTYSGFDVERFSFPAGEASKNLDTLAELLNAMGEAQLTRSDLVVALGGGVTGDMAGFAAAIYARGMRFVQIPTTLLAAVDSSVGGKTAIDMPFGKNMVGAFHQPALVVTDTDVIRELPPEQLSNGSAEAIKCGVLNDPALFALLESGDWLDRVDEVIARCVAYKRDVVAEDEFDTGARAFLNRQREQYDLVFVDVFNSHYSVPFQMGTAEAAQALRRAVAPGGAVVMNVISAITGPDGRLFRGIYGALKTAFPEVRVYPVHMREFPERVQNLMLVALPEAGRPLAPPAQSGAPGMVPGVVEVDAMLAARHTGPIPNDVPPLADDFAPVERYALMLLR